MQDEPTERSDQAEETARLWRAIRRDYFRSLEYVVEELVWIPGSTTRGAHAMRRLQRNWNALCSVNLDAASVLVWASRELEKRLRESGDPFGVSATTAELARVSAVRREIKEFDEKGGDDDAR